MDHTEEDIQRELVKKARERWDTNEAKQPYFLSDVGIDMKILGIDYRAILGEEGLKKFVRRTQHTAGYQLVEHPLQKAKVGIIPAGAKYSFPNAAHAEHDHERRSPAPASAERAVIDFLRALSHLSDEDQDAVVIPVRVLTRLFGKR